MKVLAIDTAMNACSACVYDHENGQVKSESLEMTRGHAEALMPMIERIMAKANASYGDIDLLAVTKGPGAFTGMRIGISTAKALALVLNKPLVGICSFKALLETYKAQTCPQTGHYAILIETKRTDYYFALFDSNNDAIIPGQVMPAETIIKALGKTHPVLLGDAITRFKSENSVYKNLFSSIHMQEFPDIEIISKMAIEDWERKNKKEPFTPSYLRPADVSYAKPATRYIE